MFNFMFNIFLVNKWQLSKAIAQFSSNNVLKFRDTCSYLQKLQLHMKVIFKGWKNWKFWYAIFLYALFAETFWYMRAPPR